MNTIHLTDEELEMARHALRAYLLAFGHDEADTHRMIRRVLVKLHATDLKMKGPRPSPERTVPGSADERLLAAMDPLSGSLSEQAIKG